MEDLSADPDSDESAATDPHSDVPRRRRGLGDALARLDAAQIAAGVPVAQIYGAGLPEEQVREQLAAVLPTRFVPDDLITWFGWRNGATSALAHHQAVLSPDGSDRLFSLEETVHWYERTIHSFRSLTPDDPQALWAGLWGLNLQLWSSHGSEQWFVELRPTASEPLPIQRIMMGDEPLAFRPPEPGLASRNLPAFVRHQARSWLDLAMAESADETSQHPGGSPFAKVARAEVGASVEPSTRRRDDESFPLPDAQFGEGAATGRVDAAPGRLEEGFGLNLLTAGPVENDRRSEDGGDTAPADEVAVTEFLESAESLESAQSAEPAQSLESAQSAELPVNEGESIPWS